jgi:hypothetical protein
MAGAEGQKLDKSTSSDVWKKMLSANEASMHSDEPASTQQAQPALKAYHYPATARDVCVAPSYACSQGILDVGHCIATSHARSCNYLAKVQHHQQYVQECLRCGS